MTLRQSTPPSAFTRWGAEFPRMIAPARMPSAVPRFSRNQVEAILNAGGYTPAMNSPVRKRSAIPEPGPSTVINARLARPAPMPPTAITKQGGTRSGRRR